MTTRDILAPAFAAELAGMPPLIHIEVRWPGPQLRPRTHLGEIACPADPLRAAVSRRALS
jgi:hypothetical protein